MFVCVLFGRYLAVKIIAAPDTTIAMKTLEHIRKLSSFSKRQGMESKKRARNVKMFTSASVCGQIPHVKTPAFKPINYVIYKWYKEMDLKSTCPCILELHALRVFRRLGKPTQSSN